MKDTVIIAASAVLLMLAIIDLPAQEGGYVYMPDKSNFVIWHSGGAESIVTMSRLSKWKLDGDIAAIASGKRVITAKDDAAVLAMATRMDAVMQGLMKDAQNAEDMKNYLNYVDGVLEQNAGLLQRIQLLIQQSVGVIMGPEEREISQSEIDQLVAQIDMNAGFSQFNTKKVIPFLTSQYLGLDKINVVKNPYGAFTIAEKASKTIQFLRSKAGVKSNVLTFQIQGKTLYAIHLLESISKSIDADIGEKMSDLIKNGTIIRVQQGLMIKAK